MPSTVHGAGGQGTHGPALVEAGVEAPYLGEDLLTAGCEEKVTYTPEGGEEARPVTSGGQPS